MVSTLDDVTPAYDDPMPELPVSVRLALWVTHAWGRSGDLPRAISRSHPDIDDVGGALDRLSLWHGLGEAALLVALPAPGDTVGMPPASSVVLAAAARAGECVVAPSLGGALVPLVEDYGPAEDRGTRVTWAAYDTQPVPRHQVEALDARAAARDLGRAVSVATAELEALGGLPFDQAAARRAAEADRRQWALPGDLPSGVVLTLRTAAGVATTAERGRLLVAGADVGTQAARERVLRTLQREAERVLAVAANAAAAALAGWVPGR